MSDNHNHIIKNRCRIGLAVSGGIDSMYLLHRAFANKAHADYVVLSVNHGLRAESASETEWVCSQAKSMGFENYVLTVQSSFPVRSAIQEYARTQRYHVLWQAAQHYQLDEIHLGHHANDQAETILSRLMKNSGVAGLVGMWESFYYDNICFKRPLLNLHRSEIQESMAGKFYIQDPSNMNLKFERVGYRQFLAQNHQAITHQLLVISHHAKNLMSDILYRRNVFLLQHASFYQWGYVEINRLAFDSLDDMLAKEVIKLCTKFVTGNFYIPNFELKNKTRFTMSSAEISFNKHKIVIVRENRNLSFFDEKRFVEGHLHKQNHIKEIPHKAFLSLPENGFSYNPPALRRFVNVYDDWLMKKIMA